MGFFKSLPRFGSLQSQCVRSLEKQKHGRNVNNVYVLGSGYKWNPKSAIISIAGRKYLFNCGPGLSRLLVEHKRVIRNLTGIFITRPVWENVGGLPSFLLNLRERNIRKLTVHGFDHVVDLCKTGKSILKLPNLELDVGKDDYVYDRLKITNIRLTPKSSTSTESNEDSRGNLLKCSSGSKNQLVEEVTAYVLTNKNSYSSNKYEQLVAKGVASGIQALQLLRGESITLRNGSVLHPEDITGDHLIDVALVIDCPSEAYIDSIEENETFKQHQNADENSNIVIIHFTPAAVMRQSRYIQWMKGFPSSTIHLVVNDSNLVDGLLTLRYRQQLLANLHPGIFPPLKDSGYYWMPSDKYLQDSSNLIYGQTRQYSPGSVPSTMPTAASENSPPLEKGSPEWLSQWRDLTDLNLYEGRPGTTVVFRPLAVWRENEKFFDGFSYQEVFQSTLPDSNLRALHQEFGNLGVDMTQPTKVQADFDMMYPRVVFLGTGAKCDSKERNVTGILLRINSDTNMLLDCGDGTHGQIHRLYGEKAPEIFRSINAIYISHLHVDHHMGLIDILKEREKAFGNEQIPPLVLFATKDIDKWLGFLRKIFYRFSMIAFVPLHTLMDNVEVRDSNYEEIKKYVFSRTGFSNIRTVQVRHCKESYGVALEHSDGWKISYSGDTMFSRRFIDLGKNSDLLIHEATYNADKSMQAEKNRHSTVKQALQAAHEMEANFTVLTHFSQCYFLVSRNEAFDRNNVSFAFDFMQVPLQTCNQLPMLHDVYCQMNEAYERKNFGDDWKVTGEDYD